jgi:hypothetical protein
MAENVRIDGLDKVIVGPCVNNLQSGGFCFVRTEHQYKRINFASDKPAEKLSAFADPAVTQRKA